MKQLIEEQKKQFDQLKLNDTWYCGGNQDNVEILNEETWNWHKQSLKQFIDELIAENEHQDGKLYGFDIIATEKETPTNDYIEGYKQGFKIKKKTIYDHLKKLKEELN